MESIDVLCSKVLEIVTDRYQSGRAIARRYEKLTGSNIEHLIYQVLDKLVENGDIECSKGKWQIKKEFDEFRTAKH
jgi:DNA-binding PadR family transcriptional regulator